MEQYNGVLWYSTAAENEKSWKEIATDGLFTDSVLILLVLKEACKISFDN